MNALKHWEWKKKSYRYKTTNVTEMLYEFDINYTFKFLKHFNAMVIALLLKLSCSKFQVELNIH